MDGGHSAMNRIGIAMLFVLLLICFGCEKPIERPMVLGKYKANHQKGIDSLELKPDGTYTYYYKAFDGKEIKNANINRPIIETTLGSIPCRFVLEV
jgi:hypothetical protein